jgi:hypothetical protein
MPRRPSLSCRQFRAQHVEYVDGFLAGDLLHACETHLDECSVCRRQDVMVRRSLIALQALPVIEPSADFHRRLCDRLANDTMHYAPAVPPRVRWGVTVAILAASVALLIAAPPQPRGSHPSGVTIVQAPVLLGKSSPRDAASRQVAVIPAASASAVLPPKSRAPKNTASENARTARFEALPGQAPLRTDVSQTRPQSVRLQTVTYIGQ